MARICFSRLVLSAAFGGMASVSTAIAADMQAPVHKALPVVAPFSWTGFYVGASAGAGWTKAKPGLSAVNGADLLYDPPNIPGLSALGSPGLSGAHGIVGGKAGYNQQWGNVVAGVEGDISFPNYLPSNHVVSSAVTALSSAEERWDYVASLRARLGYATGNWLFYATGGAAFAGERFLSTPTGGNEEKVLNTRLGWTAGGGVEGGLVRVLGERAAVEGHRGGLRVVGDELDDRRPR